MNTPTIPIGFARRAKPRTALAILAGGFVGGTVDIGAAALINGSDPRFIMRIVAGGMQGKAALQGGAASAWLGLFLQWGMSILIAAIFVVAVRRVRWPDTRWFTAGLVYGAIVFVVMNYVVLPFSAWDHVAHFTVASLVWNFLAMLLFGLIVSGSCRVFLGAAAGRR